MPLAQRPANRHQGGPRRPSMSYCNLRCAFCSRRAADVSPCSTCGWTCCTSDATCHRAHLPRTFAATGAQLDGWNLLRGNK